MAIGYVGRLGMTRNSLFADESMFVVSASILQTLRTIVGNSFFYLRLMNDNRRSSARFMLIASLQKARHYPMRIGM